MPHDFPQYVPGLYGSCNRCGSVYPGSTECSPSPTIGSRPYAINDAGVISRRIAELYAERTVALNTPTITFDDLLAPPIVDDFYDGCC